MRLSNQKGNLLWHSNGIGTYYTSNFKNQNVVLPVSSYLEGEYKQEDVYIGVPTLINRNGAVKVYETQLNSEESEKFENSAIILKDMQNKIKQLIA